ncbi:MAG: LL-diaminopimelate aminotransferase [Deltaproteobacteria bacterium CG11_big_fil_rev_8_21_14_0_20_47_16]|nr:MAG: LL-diaminopimelate aminotransferase [Deltaproteobacteria bacterium CG11_big_fil_rev_8_21_14_0_20_47_16]
MTTFKEAARLQELPPYLFAEIDKKKAELRAKGMDLISLGIGDPDMPTPKHIVEAMQKAAANPETHPYPPYDGAPQFKKAACAWMKKYYNVEFDPSTECLTLIGSKEGIAHIPWTFVNPGDAVLVPSPGYPVYSSATTFCGGIPHFMPLTRENKFLPDLKKIPEDILKKTKIMFLNYPNNPTSAVATREFFQDVVALAKKYNFIICHDAAYMEIFYDGKRPLSIFQVEGAKDVAIEMHSLSKTFNMTGWRLGFAVGNKAIVQSLAKMKTHLDSGAFVAIQDAGVAALQSPESVLTEIRNIYQQRRDKLVSVLKAHGWDIMVPEATFYVWAATPKGVKAKDFAVKVMEQTGVVITPGTGFGDYGEGYVRFSLTAPPEKLEEAVHRLQKL